jgi:membrane protein YdbS with pleckstrin-like domain
MKRHSPKTYKSRRPLKIAVTVFLCLLLVFIITAVSLFFGLRRYIVYDQDGGLHLEIPWLEEDTSGAQP